MNILYVSNYLDDNFFQKIFEIAKVKPVQNMQKFNSLLVTGMANSADVDAITVLTSAAVNREISNKLFWKGKNYHREKTSFWYLPFINLKVFKQICLGFFSIFFVLFWCMKNQNKNNVLICDGFYPIVSTISTIICKLFGIKVITLYTDLTKVDVNDTVKSQSLIKKIIKKIIIFGDSINCSLSDEFILLTEAMNNIINKSNKPYIVIEGLVDSKLTLTSPKKKKHAIMYAGGLYEKYGVKLLIDAFIELDNDEYELWLCGGDGDLVSYISLLENRRIKYFGALPNSKVVELEKKCTLLVNPRLTNEEYTKYSFPSKNMEYMISGTPVLTTKLPGMPEEYNDYVFLIEDETKDGIKKELDNILKKTDAELNTFGKKAQKFVKQNKNNCIQAQKIIDFVMKHDGNSNNFKKCIFFMSTFVSILFFLIGYFINNITLCKNSLISEFVILLIFSLFNYKRYFPYIYFLISFFTFTLGQYLFKNITLDFMYYKNFPTKYVNTTMLIQLLALIFSFLGYNLAFKFKINSQKTTFNCRALSIFKNIILVGLVVSSICSLSINIEMAICTLTNDYLSLYNGTYKSIFPEVVSRIATYYFIFFAFFLSLNKNKNYTIISFIIFLADGFFNLLAGMRYIFIFDLLFLTFYLYLYYVQNKILISRKIKKIMILFIALIPFALVGLNLYNNIRNNLPISNINISDEFKSFFVSQGRSVNVITYAQIYKTELTATPTYYVFGLFEQSVINKINHLSMGIIKIPDLASVRKLNLGLDLSYVVLGEQLVNDGHGLGSQFLAELYVEGGFFGVIIYCLVFGYLISMFYQCAFKNFIYQFFCMSLLNPILHISRSVSFELFAPFVSSTSILLIALFLIINNVYNTFQKSKSGV